MPITELEAIIPSLGNRQLQVFLATCDICGSEFFSLSKKQCFHNLQMHIFYKHNTNGYISIIQKTKEHTSVNSNDFPL